MNRNILLHLHVCAMFSSIFKCTWEDMCAATHVCMWAYASIDLKLTLIAYRLYIKQVSL